MIPLPIVSSIQSSEKFEESIEQGFYKPIKVRRLSLKLDELVHFDNRAMYRSLSRSTALVLRCIEKAGGASFMKGLSTGELGIYIATPARPFSLSSLRYAEKNLSAPIFEITKRSESPKEVLKSGAGMGSAQIGIYLQSQGPAYGLSHPKSGFKHALQRAVMDLKLGRIKRALAGVGFSPEDVFELEKTYSDQSVFQESAGIVLFDDPESITDLVLTDNSDWSRGLASTFKQI